MPAAASISRSFAPSPTATVSSMAIPCNCSKLTQQQRLAFAVDNLALDFAA
jgi:hypothetical protein